jgi:hypothetical protein
VALLGVGWADIVNPGLYDRVTALTNEMCWLTLRLKHDSLPASLPPILPDRLDEEWNLPVSLPRGMAFGALRR